MKDYLKQLIEKTGDNRLARCIIREYFQARLLEGLQENGAFETWAFVGGTALRFLYSMPRFSVDLDFSLCSAGVEHHFTDMMKKARNSFHAEDYSVAITAKTTKTVKSAFLKFPGLLYELNLSPYQTESISIKVELDTNPPAGAHLETSIIRKHCMLNLMHHDKSSLLAGKLHTLLSRKYLKGRDVYDLIWYLSDRSWPAPNIDYLNNALRQTGWKEKPVTADNWKKNIAQKLSDCNWENVLRDVRPFLEKPGEVQLLTKSNLLNLLKD